jgi:arginase family enzyme
VLTSEQVRGESEELRSTLARLGEQGPVYLHIDVDVLDQTLMPGVVYPTSGGLSVTELEGLLRAVRVHVEPAAITLTAVNLTDGHEEDSLAAAVRIAAAALGQPAGV